MFVYRPICCPTPKFPSARLLIVVEVIIIPHVGVKRCSSSVRPSFCRSIPLSVPYRLLAQESKVSVDIWLYVKKS